jgi:hypothetical protein
MEDETGPCNGVKGAVDAYDSPLEARVPRLDRCCLKQKVGYSRDTAPKNNHHETDRPLTRRETAEQYPPFSEKDFLSGTDNARVQAIRARYRFGCQGETCHYFGKTRTILRREFGVFPDSRSGKIIGDFHCVLFPETSLASQDLQRNLGKFFQDPFPV